MSSEPLKVRLETNDSVISKNWRVFVGGLDLSRYVSDIVIDAGVSKPNKVTLTLINVSIDQPKAGSDEQNK